MFFIGNVLFAQQSDNRFSQSEENSSNGYDHSLPAAEPEPGEGPSNPDGEDDDPVPIDDYLPVLVITALGMIVFAGYRKKQSI